MGTGHIGLPTLETLIRSAVHQVIGVVTQPDKPVGRKQLLTPSVIKTRATAADIPVLQPLKIRTAEVLAEIRQLDPEVIVVMAYGQLLPQVLLDLPSIACLNLHASLLPRHRGASPINAAILAGDEVTGITLMYMNAGLDTGDILLRREIPILPRETAGELHDRLGLLAPAALQAGLTLLEQQLAPRIPQDHSQATVCGKLDRDSGRLDWEQPADYLDRLIRAMTPWPGAFTVLPDGRKWKIHRTFPCEESGAPGQIIRADSQGIVIGAGANSLCLQEVQVEGRNKMPAYDFLRGNPLQTGDLLPFRA